MKQNQASVAAPLVLVVEDEPGIATILRAYLERDGLRAQVAQDGPEAVQLFRRHQPDLLTNLERGKDAIAFEADIHDGGKVDMSIKLPITERVIVKRLSDGKLDISHPDEPDFQL